MYYVEQFYTKVQTKKNNKSLSNHNIWNVFNYKAKQKENNFLVFYIKATKSFEITNLKQ